MKITKTKKTKVQFFLSLSFMAAVLLLSLILLMASSFTLSHADPGTDIVSRICDSVPAQNPKEYIQHYNNIVMNYMQPEIYRNKFAVMETGKPPDKVYVLAQCMDDLSSKECETCFSMIRTLLASCFPATGGRVYLDGCFIRAENYSFFQETVSNDDIKRCSNDIAPIDQNQYTQIVRRVISRIINMAPDDGNFAVQHKTSDILSVYGMAACWKTLDNESCATCLEDAATALYSCLPSSKGRVLNAGCFLCYSNYEFANDPKGTRETIVLYVSFVLAAIAICSVAIGIGFFVGKLCYRHINQRRTKMELSALDKSLHHLQFKYSTLEKATQSFNEAHKLGSGGYGEVFKGTLPDGREIAIKRLYASCRGQFGNIYNEMDIISRAKHKNLVRFLGCCFHNMDSFLVYEYLANKSLDLILFDLEKKKELDWKKRLGIIIGTAEGLQYLHKDCKVRIIHRDIKASNILLDLKHKPKISDFGLARLMNSDKSLISTAIAGTLGYMAPEYIAKGRLTEKVDVYSFGVLVLEIVSGVQNNKWQSEESFETLVTHAWKNFQSNTVSEIIDESMDIHQDVEEIKRVVQVGLLCTQESPSLRPTMNKVVQMLTQMDIEFPTPCKPPFTDEAMELSGSLDFHHRRHSCLSNCCIRQNFDSEPE